LVRGFDPIVEEILPRMQPINVTATTMRSANIPTAWDDPLAYFGM